MLCCVYITKFLYRSDVYRFLMADYTLHELADMHLIYGEARCNGREARRLYAERFPQRRLPNHVTFQKLDGRLRETGVLRAARPDAGRPRTVRTVQFEEAVLQRIEDNPSTSTRAIAKDLNTSNANVWNVLHEMGMHPFKTQKVHELSADDFPQRVAFCQWYLHQIVNIPDFLTHVLFTDEASFTREGIVNIHNSHVWDFVNPKATRVFHNQRRFTINVWAGIVHDHLIGPYLLPNRLGGGNYRTFLCDVLPELLENVPLAVRQRLWFQHDGAPPHFALNVRQYLNNVFPNCWIGRGGPIQWPPRSPDLTPMDFFFWGEMKRLVYETPIETPEELVARVVAAAAIIRETPGCFERVRQSFARRCQLAINVNGRHFQQHL